MKKTKTASQDMGDNNVNDDYTAIIHADDGSVVNDGSVKGISGTLTLLYTTIIYTPDVYTALPLST